MAWVSAEVKFVWSQNYYTNLYYQVPNLSPNDIILPTDGSFTLPSSTPGPEYGYTYWWVTAVYSGGSFNRIGAYIGNSFVGSFMQSTTVFIPGYSVHKLCPPDPSVFSAHFDFGGLFSGTQFTTYRTATFLGSPGCGGGGVQAEPTLTTQVSAASVGVGVPIWDTATLIGGNNPTGTMAFHVIDQADGGGVYSSTVQVSGNGTYASVPVPAPYATTFLWRAEYSGDANNLGASTAYGDPNESIVVGGGGGGGSVATYRDVLTRLVLTDHNTRYRDVGTRLHLGGINPGVARYRQSDQGRVWFRKTHP